MSTLRVAPILIAGALLFAACGGGDGEAETAQIATLETTTPPEQAADAAVTAPAPTAAAEEPNDSPVEDDEVTFEDAALDFAQCMRENGFENWPDPNAGATVSDLLRTDIEALGIDRNDADFQDTIQLCRQAFEGVAGAQQEFTPDQTAAIQDAVIEIFVCVRQLEGYEGLPDPDFTAQGGLRGAFATVFATGEYNVADTLEVISQCREELGFPALGQGG